MKAEHRKELETNLLADKMGQVITTAKQGPSRKAILYVLLGLVVFVALFFLYRWFVFGSTRNAELWYFIEDGDRKSIIEVYKAGASENPGKVVRFQLAWEDLWLRGLKKLGGNPKSALQAIADAEAEYKKLAEECKGDPVFEPEALFALAAIEETRAIENRDNLASALDKYKAVVKANKNSAFARWAELRIDDLEDDEKNRAIQRFYQDLQVNLKRMEAPLMPPDLNLKK